MNLDPQELINRRMDLSLQSEIPNMAEHAEEWRKLSADFEVVEYIDFFGVARIGMPANVAMCNKNYQHYKEIADGEYIRLVKGSFAELIPTTVKEKIFKTGDGLCSECGEVMENYHCENGHFIGDDSIMPNLSRQVRKKTTH